jgi:hypothetical protein
MQNYRKQRSLGELCAVLLNRLTELPYKQSLSFVEHSTALNYDGGKAKDNLIVQNYKMNEE